VVGIAFCVIYAAVVPEQDSIYMPDVAKPPTADALEKDYNSVTGQGRRLRGWYENTNAFCCITNGSTSGWRRSIEIRFNTSKYVTYLYYMSNM
jgi:hypothetical protein